LCAKKKGFLQGNGTLFLLTLRKEGRRTVPRREGKRSRNRITERVAVSRTKQSQIGGRKGRESAKKGKKKETGNRARFSGRREKGISRSSPLSDRKKTSKRHFKRKEKSSLG